ncbi:putative uncharacterized protein DDB_G0288959 [Gordionus sp. m RMFG-2023]|uniref:putative uncharacterized protein DDB_G0288959 n=1 Tax=Gordionus sp. m RMFG-2023 TaxID=3053472 RepID=UPI0031FBC7C3
MRVLKQDYPKNIDDVVWADLYKIAKQLYKDERTVLASRINFIRLSSGPTESVLSYLKTIKELTRRCEFEDNVELRIHDQLIAGLKMSQLDKKLLRYLNTRDEDQSLSLNKVIEMALAMEWADLEINNTMEIVYKIKGTTKHNDNNKRLNQNDNNNREYNDNDNKTNPGKKPSEKTPGKKPLEKTPRKKNPLEKNHQEKKNPLEKNLEIFFRIY